MSAFIPTTLPLRHSLPSSNRQTPRCAVDKEAPPASRFAKNFPEPRFEAPHLSFFTCEVPLMNGIGLVREPVELDLEKAGQTLAELRAAQAKAEGDFSVIFSGPTTDPYATDPALKYYPMSRRDEAPIIEITGSDQSDASVTIALGSVVATPPPEEEKADLADVKLASPWNQGPSVSASKCIDMFYSEQYRNKAPVIEFGSDLSISMQMKDVVGEPDAPLYPEESRFMAPKIEIRKPFSDGDTTAFVNLSMEEAQLPLIEAACLQLPS